MNIAVVTDSTAYIPKEMREQHQIHMIPLQVVFGEETYREEIELDWKSFYEEVKNIMSSRRLLSRQSASWLRCMKSLASLMMRLSVSIFPAGSAEHSAVQQRLIRWSTILMCIHLTQRSAAWLKAFMPLKLLN